MLIDVLYFKVLDLCTRRTATCPAVTSKFQEFLPAKRTSLEEGHLLLYLTAVALMMHQHFEVAGGQQETWKLEEHQRSRVRARLHTS
jgi:hypothetical protein